MPVWFLSIWQIGGSRIVKSIWSSIRSIHALIICHLTRIFWILSFEIEFYAWILSTIFSQSIISLISGITPEYGELNITIPHKRFRMPIPISGLYIFFVLQEIFPGMPDLSIRTRTYLTVTSPFLYGRIWKKFLPRRMSSSPLRNGCTASFRSLCFS